MSEAPLERRAIISGIGQSAIGRRLGRTALDLTVEAALRAIADAGLDPRRHRRPVDVSGQSRHRWVSGPGTPEVQDALRLRLNWYEGGAEGPGQLRRFFAACLAVAAGLARHVPMYRTVTESTAQGVGGRQGSRVPRRRAGRARFGGFLQWISRSGRRRR